VFSSGCFYFNRITNSWSSFGLETDDSSSTLDFIDCSTYHLTEFTSGIFPASLNFDSIFARASFLQNLTIYLTVIISATSYAILMIISRSLDKIDEKKLGLVKLKSRFYEKYLYEIIVYTGQRKEAATDSKVRIYISGSEYQTDAVLLTDPQRPAFRRGGIDSFIHSFSK
jgi:hypothetical protein